MTIDPDVDAYFENATDWPDEQRSLREILRRTPLVEAYKWKQPVYTHHGANLVTIWAFKDGCGLGFFKACCCPIRTAFSSRSERTAGRP